MYVVVGNTEKNINVVYATTNKWTEAARLQLSLGIRAVTTIIKLKMDITPIAQ